MQGLPLTKLAIYSFFVQRVKEHLHLVLCMSPVGDAFRWACLSMPTSSTAWCLTAAPSSLLTSSLCALTTGRVPCRQRLRMFPALINGCTIDWFREWPQEALSSVANSFFQVGSTSHSCYGFMSLPHNLRLRSLLAAISLGSSSAFSKKCCSNCGQAAVSHVQPPAACRTLPWDQMLPPSCSRV